METASISICHHSVTGHTKAIAEEIARGADAAGAAEATLVNVTSPGLRWERLLESDAVVFGCPTYFGGVSAAMKGFMDSTDAFWRQMRWRDRLAAAFTCAGEPSGDKQSVLMTFCTFAMQHGMIWVGMDAMNDVRTGAGKPEGYNARGAYQGAMADACAGTATTTSPSQTDRITARLFGARVARTAARWRNGAAQPARF